TLELLENDRPDSFLLKGLEKSIDQSNLESYESLENKSNDESDLGIPIRLINSVNTPYSVEQRTARPDGVKSEHLYSASANEINEKRPKLKIQDVEKNEIVKLLDSSLIYLISDIVGFFQIPIALEDQEKTTFTCPYRTFAYMYAFGLCNAPVTFQRCMTTIFHDMVEDFMEVFMDDFSMFGNSFDCCLANLDRMLARCKETNLLLS
ncbi:reverse transcriptase domain-containing protein, partial [Tanacetum coccineum]